MLAVVLFKTSKVAFKTVGGDGDVRMREIVKHIGQRVEEHASRSFEITGNPAVLGSCCDLMAIPLLPLMKTSEKENVLFGRCDGRHQQEESSQDFGIRSFWVDTAPHESLALDVDEAALNEGGRPQCGDGTNDMWISVEGHTHGVEALLFERQQEVVEL